MNPKTRPELPPRLPVGADELRTALPDDRLDRARTAWAEHARPSLRTYGPRNRRELLGLFQAQGGPGHG